MDIVTQGLAGAAVAQAFAPARHSRLAALIGLGAGLLPDADALISSAADPLLQLEFHRHFSHALVFIPAGAAIATALLWFCLRRVLSFKQIYRCALCGYAPGGLLDACTSYGTHLFWPFSAAPVAWSLIAIVDPVFSLLLAVPLALGLQRRRPMRAGLVLALVYLLLGLVQHQRAEAAARDLALERGHAPRHLLVKPTVGNLVLWRALYVTGDSVWVDAVRVGASGRIYEGGRRALFSPQRDLAWAADNSRSHRDAARFVAFSRGYAVLYPGSAQRLGDVRYAMLPTSTEPLWGIEFDPNAADAAPRWITSRTLTPAIRRQFFAMLLGRDPGE